MKKWINSIQFFFLYKGTLPIEESSTATQNVKTERLFENFVLCHSLSNESNNSVHRNAVRTDAGEDRTASHTVPLRDGAMQRDACAYCF